MNQANSEKTGKIKKNTKIIVLVTIIAIIICIIGIVWFLNSSNVEVAQLVIEYGSVEIKQEGKPWNTASNGMILHKLDSIRTKNNSRASIILFESSIIRLDNNTEIKLQEIIKDYSGTDIFIKQDSGRTWNTVLKISGIDDYEVQTPTAVASVRGTSFHVTVYENGSISVGVVEGITNVSSVKDSEKILGINVSENESVLIDPNKIYGPFDVEPLIYDNWVIENIGKDQELMDSVKDELYNRIEPYIPELKERFGINDEELEALIEGYVKGYYDLPPDTPEWIRDLIEIS